MAARCWSAGAVVGRRVVQVHARSPVDVRRLYRRRHPLIPKALGVFALGRGPRAPPHAAPPRRELGLRAVELLDADRSAGPDAWGYPWDVQTRWSFYPAGSPNVVATAFAASGLLEAGAAARAAVDLVDRAPRRRALGARRAVDRAGGVLRLSRRVGP